jgi:pimeloyl-ACP methyl ester carboxylesterase
MIDDIAAAGAPPTRSRVIAGVGIEMVERGSGRPLLFLHPEIGLAADAEVLDRLARNAHLFAPSHPGFGNSEQPAAFTTIDDLAYFYLDLLDELDLHDAVLVGVSFGGWIAAEIAIKSCARLSRLVLANPVGIKVSDRETRDIADIFAVTEEQYAALAYFDPALAKHDYKSMPESEVRKLARNREATARYGWSPYLHDPKLKQRLNRIRVPTLLLSGAADRILAPGYVQAYCAAIPGARLETIERVGHFPHIEQPEQFAERVFAFVNGTK